LQPTRWLLHDLGRLLRRLLLHYPGGLRSRHLWAAAPVRRRFPGRRRQRPRRRSSLRRTPDAGCCTSRRWGPVLAIRPGLLLLATLLLWHSLQRDGHEPCHTVPAWPGYGMHLFHDRAVMDAKAPALLAFALSQVSCSLVTDFSSGGDASAQQVDATRDSQLHDALRSDARLECTQDQQCSDGITCTVDSCSVARICQHRASDSRCPQGNPCVRYRCDPTAPTADPAGCVSTRLACPSSAPACDPAVGCVQCVSAADCLAPDCCTGMQCVNDHCAVASGCSLGMTCCVRNGVCRGCQHLCN
jgi:hypothetical protein